MIKKFEKLFLIKLFKQVLPYQAEDGNALFHLLETVEAPMVTITQAYKKQISRRIKALLKRYFSNHPNYK
ncbi:hypothetical protein GQ61_06980 [Candidatus Nucleicultrix amoebiphila FS5]|uniref:Uncharacterized protein n=1 Tax=Candidatus Nucleicultrix amoebiphila FS5 TaxID=1414854 RepID=A0A1W6N5D0_9PROT|nr:hypothetical protein GQ61_06980 [Candidatus Nucleicultrix amoebiphila FS5]